MLLITYEDNKGGTGVIDTKDLHKYMNIPVTVKDSDEELVTKDYLNDVLLEATPVNRETIMSTLTTAIPVGTENFLAGQIYYDPSTDEWILTKKNTIIRL